MKQTNEQESKETRDGDPVHTRWRSWLPLEASKPGDSTKYFQSIEKMKPSWDYSTPVQARTLKLLEF